MKDSKGYELSDYKTGISNTLNQRLLTPKEIKELIDTNRDLTSFYIMICKGDL